MSLFEKIRDECYLQKFFASEFEKIQCLFYFFSIRFMMLFEKNYSREFDIR